MENILADNSNIKLLRIKVSHEIHSMSYSLNTIINLTPRLREEAWVTVSYQF